MSVKGAGWLLGVILVAGMFVGARWALGPTSATTTSTGKAGLDAGRPPSFVVCWGNFDVEPGVNRNLYPRQFGDILDVVAENTAVKEGAVLLQVNDRLARIELEKAELAEKVAGLQLKEAEDLPQLYKLQEKQQGAAIAAIDHEIKELEKDRDSKLKLLKGEPTYDTVKERYDFGLLKLKEKRKAEDAKLDQIKLQKAPLKIEQAQADVAAKKLLVRQAKEALEHFKVVAPRDGFVLRVNVKKGEILGPNPMMPALEFKPDLPIIVRAEILQEWGRYVKEGQLVEIEDDVYQGPKWEGKVKGLSEWYALTRTPVIEPFRYNDVRTMECKIELTGPRDAAKPRIGQRVRAKIKI